MQPTIMVPGGGARYGGRRPPHLAATLGLALGLNILLLLLCAAAWVGMVLAGEPWAPLAAALDPRVGGSLPDLWAGMQLALTSTLLGLLARRRRRPALWVAAAAVLILLTAEMLMSHLFLSAWLQEHFPSADGTRGLDPLAAKLLASAAVGACALVPAAALCHARAPCSRAFGRVLLGFVVAIGTLGIGLDLLSSIAGMLYPASAAVMVAGFAEEVAELFAVTIGCAVVLDRAWGLAADGSLAGSNSGRYGLGLRLSSSEMLYDTARMRLRQAG